MLHHIRVLPDRDMPFKEPKSIFTPYSRFTRSGKTRIYAFNEPKSIFYTISAFYPIG